MDGLDLTTLTPEQLERFRSKVDKSAGPDACHPWIGTRTRQGYGIYALPGRRRRIGAHRLALMLSTGQALPRKVLACHTCDNPPCCNPLHLYAASHAQNMRDAVATGRMKSERGADHPGAKLSEGDVVVILDMIVAGRSPIDIARQFHVTTGAIYGIKRGVTWPHIPRPSGIPWVRRR